MTRPAAPTQPDPPDRPPRERGRRIVLIACSAEVLTMVGVFAFAALLPTFMVDWSLSSTQAGWIGGIVFAGYAVAAPVLVALTDRVDARRVFMAGAALAGLANVAFALWADGFWSALVLRALAGAGLAGTYMPGLRMMVDRLPTARRVSAVPLYTASFSLGSAASYLIPGLVADWAGWRGAFAVAGGCALLAALLPLMLKRHRPDPPPETAAGGRRGALLDFRPVFAERAAMAYVLGYVAHMWELFAFRAWVVAFLGVALAWDGGAVAAGWGQGPLSPGSVASLGALLAMAASIGGARWATRRGRARMTRRYMAASALTALAFGWLAGLPYPLVALAALLYAALIQLDSAALTTGAVETAPAGRRGATLAVHSLLGFGAAFVGPLVFGVTLDVAGGQGSGIAWGLAFALVGLVGLLGVPALAAALVAERRRTHE